MPARESRREPVSDLDQRTMTRLQALAESLKAGTSPEPTREFSTLVERSDSSQVVDQVENDGAARAVWLRTATAGGADRDVHGQVQE